MSEGSETPPPSVDRDQSQLLASDEPGPFRILNPLAETPVLLVCDHASCRFPAALGDMGLDPFARLCHLAVDIGAGPLTEALAERLGVAAVLHNYSRLVVDCNRQLMDPSAFLEYGDGILVPGNRNLQREDKERRANALYWPYHRAIDEQIKRLSACGPAPVFVAIHSFTPVLNGESRGWQIGVLWDKDERVKQIFLEDFRAAGYYVGDNEPYSGKAPQDFTIDHHAEEIGLPHVGLEIRQDLLGDSDSIQRIATIMEKTIESLPERIGLLDKRISA
ncbi:MAG: N-formylglutamate amidohydrolase [Gammaproteobacteria bacterium]|nr:N-formylglutamate amidohydrolase [Gammaproteobacteria bacterium]